MTKSEISNVMPRVFPRVPVLTTPVLGPLVALIWHWCGWTHFWMRHVKAAELRADAITVARQSEKMRFS